MTKQETQSTALDQELRAMWQDSPEEAPTPTDLLADVQQQAEALSRKVLRRDIVETLAAVFVWGVFAVAAFKAPGLVPKLGLLLGTGFLVAPVWKLHHERRKHRETPPDAPVAHHLERELERVKGQIRLLDRVASWYVTPLAIGGTVILAGLAAVVPTSSPGGRAVAVLASVAFSAVLFLGLGWVIVRLNRFAIKTNLLPIKSDLQKALASLSPQPPPASEEGSPASREPSTDSRP